MLTIHKFPINITDEQVIVIKGLDGVLPIAVVNNELFLYAMVDTDKPIKTDVKVFVKGTGDPIHRDSKLFGAKFFGTHVQEFASTDEGTVAMVWHVWVKV